LELGNLQCGNKGNEERYQDEGINTISQLAWIIHEVSSEKSKDALKG